jgi:hypothetical protein
MNISPRFVSHVFTVTAGKMAGIGFKKRQAGIFTLCLNEEVLGWVGLNTAHYAGGVLTINPTVGVRHQELETLVSNLMGMKPHQYIPPTIGTPIGYLTPKKQFTTWSFQEGTDCDAVVAEMVETVDKVGKPFMKRNANLLAVYETMLNSGLGIRHQLDYRIPTACALLGKNAEAEAVLNDRLRAISGKVDPASASFSKFAGRLREVLATDGKR